MPHPFVRRRRPDSAMPRPDDLVAVAFDDAVLDRLAARSRRAHPRAGPDRVVDGSDDAAFELLADWQDDLATREQPPPLGVQRAAELVSAGRRRSSFRPAMAVAAAICTLLAGSAVIGARSARPGDPLFAVTQVVWSQRADSAVANQQVRDVIASARTALAAGRSDHAAELLQNASRDMERISDGGDRAAAQQELSAVLAQLDDVDPAAARTAVGGGQLFAGQLQGTDPVAAPPLMAAPPAGRTPAGPAVTSPAGTSLADGAAAPPAPPSSSPATGASAGTAGAAPAAACSPATGTAAAAVTATAAGSSCVVQVAATGTTSAPVTTSCPPASIPAGGLAGADPATSIPPAQATAGQPAPTTAAQAAPTTASTAPQASNGTACPTTATPGTSATQTSGTTSPTGDSTTPTSPSPTVPVSGAAVATAGAGATPPPDIPAGGAGGADPGRSVAAQAAQPTG